MIWSRKLAPNTLLGLAIGALLYLPACANQPAPTPPPPYDEPIPADQQLYDYYVGPGDVLRVNVAGHPELSSTPYKTNVLGSPVDGSGTIQLPYIGEVEVSQKTVFEIKKSVEELLKKYLKQPAVDVAVIEFGSQRIYVLGEVENPGMFVLDRPLNVFQALALTGGFTDDANREQIARVRGKVDPENIELFDAETVNVRGGLMVASGDLIFVGRHKWAGVGAVARDLVPLLQLIALPVGTARDVALFQDIRDR